MNEHSQDTNQTRMVEATASLDGTTFHTLSIFPDTPPVAQLEIFHGYGDHSGRYRHFMTWMAERRIACYAADARGHGRSGGRRGFISKWEDFLRDADQIVRSREADPAIPRFILGHSHGGLVVAMGAIRGLFAEGLAMYSGYS